MKTTNGHVLKKNVLKRHQNIIIDIPIPNFMMPILTSTILKLKFSTPNRFGSLDFRPCTSDGEQMVIKAWMLHNQSKSMAMMASPFSSTSKI
jgi:hypothetical protein